VNNNKVINRSRVSSSIAHSSCQLALGHLPGSAAAAIIGVLAGQIYRSELANLKSYRIPLSVVRFSTRFLLPLIGSTRPPRRLNRALPDESRTALANLSSPNQDQEQNEEVITTARPTTASETRGRAGPPTVETRSSVVREWVNELTGRTERENAGIRVPSEAEITQLTSMFPDLQRQTVVGALQRRYDISFGSFAPVSPRQQLATDGLFPSPNIEGAVETLLGSQG